MVPARYATVQLAFDIAWLRPTHLIAYDTEPRAATPPMHIWDAESRDWKAISNEGYEQGTVFKSVPGRLVIIGEEGKTPASMDRHPSWVDEMIRIPSLSAVTIVNTLNDSMALTPKEWHWLAKRQKLELTDLNAERRRYGRYGKPGSARTPPAPPKDAGSAEEDVPEVIRIEMSSPVPNPAPVPLTVESPAIEAQEETVVADAPEKGLAPIPQASDGEDTAGGSWQTPLLPEDK